MSTNATDTTNTLNKAFVNNGNMKPPITCAITNVTIKNNATSLTRIRAITNVTKKFTIPIFTNTSPKLFDKNHLDNIDHLNNKTALFETPQHTPWQKKAHHPATS